MPTEPRLLCVSIHDVAPPTWRDCERLLRAVREVADVPLTWLVVPRYHGHNERSPAMEEALGELVVQAHELALHGYTHVDTAPLSGRLRSDFLRSVYTTREGEFSALTQEDARERIRMGLDWFAERGWPVYGFVPPAWLLGEEAWKAVRSSGLAYTTTFSRFHLLGQGRSVLSPSLVYAARNRAGRFWSPLAAGAGALLLARAPVVRLSLHPPDARHPRLLLHAQRLIERLLKHRTAVTKAACARALTKAPTSPRLDSIQGRNTGY
jgi:predicted deacetylase